MTATLVDDLLRRMAEGDRVAASEFLERFGARLRRRIHGKIGWRMRRIFDSEDLLIATEMQLDRLVRAGKFCAATEIQAIALLMTITEHTLMKGATRASLMQRVETKRAAQDAQHNETAITQKCRESGNEVSLRMCLRLLSDRQDRTILFLRFRGWTHQAIAEKTCMSASAVRQRWNRIRARLRRSMTRITTNG